MIIRGLALIALGAITCVLGGCGPSDASDSAHPEVGNPTPASESFWDRWSDGKAELSGYRIRTPRYGELREGSVVLVYVTEEMNTTTRIKDDTGTVPDDEKTVVLKLNHTLSFRTGIYPYSVMTSVFSPAGSTGRERFAPTKITFTSQEWCGHVFHMLWPDRDQVRSEIHSYFSSEGDETRVLVTPELTLYEDALFIQLRELDGPFAGGGDWSGPLMPALWSLRRAHVAADPVHASITRGTGTFQGQDVTVFRIAHGDFTRTVYVETAEARRILGWETSEGEHAEILGTTRLPYWKLNHVGEESYLERLGLTPDDR